MKFCFLRCKRRTPLPLIRMGIAALARYYNMMHQTVLCYSSAPQDEQYASSLPHGLPQCGTPLPSAFPPACRAAQLAFPALASTCSHLFVHFLVGDLCAAVQVVHQLADFLVQCFALGVQIENLQDCAGRQCKVVRLFAGYACRMTGDLARFYPPCPLPYPEKPAFSYP